MEQYEEFLNRIKKYFDFDEVISQGTIINAYDLLCILQERIDILHSLIYEKKSFVKEIEDYYKGKNIFENLFQKITKKQTPKVDFVRQSYEKNRARIYISFQFYTCKMLDYRSLEICKENGTDELYFGNPQNVDKEFVEYFREQFLHNLQTLEEFMDLYKLSLPNIQEIPTSGSECIEEIIDDEFLKLRIVYDTFGMIGYNISIVPNIDQENIFERVWLDHSSLREFVVEHKTELLKRIPINILALKETTQKIITDYYSRNNIEEHNLRLK